ncbi:MAG: hypothetical protein NTW96_10155 [Planctomycetia bacterium]|nr:hypothetical protein [Planctomycetia bacterium]
MRKTLFIALALLAASTALHADPHPPRPYPTNDNPASHIRFRTASEAEPHRERLIRFIWPGGLPTNTMPSVSVNVGFNPDLAVIVPSRVSRVDRLVADINGLESIAYLPALGGAGEVLRLFLEPTVQTVNHFQHARPDMKDATMIGLSGGGWTIAMVAAIDTRIKLSIPVAGCAPIYVQNRIGSIADVEQVFAPLLGEGDATHAPDGVATYLEHFVLAACGPGRRQIMVTIPGEPVGLFPTTWATDTTLGGHTYGVSVKDFVTGAVANVGSGQWSQVYNTSGPEHRIAPSTINDVILPALLTPDATGQEPRISRRDDTTARIEVPRLKIYSLLVLTVKR